MNTSPASLMSTYKPLSFEPSIPENDETIIYSGKSECMLINVALLYSLTHFKLFFYTQTSNDVMSLISPIMATN